MDYTWYITGILVRVVSLVQLLALVYLFYMVFRFQRIIKHMHTTVTEVTSTSKIFLSDPPLSEMMRHCPLYLKETAERSEGEEENDKS